MNLSGGPLRSQVWSFTAILSPLNDVQLSTTARKQFAPSRRAQLRTKWAKHAAVAEFRPQESVTSHTFEEIQAEGRWHAFEWNVTTLGAGYLALAGYGVGHVQPACTPFESAVSGPWSYVVPRWRRTLAARLFFRRRDETWQTVVVIDRLGLTSSLRARGRGRNPKFRRT
jgi:hypothetical protein